MEEFNKDRRREVFLKAQVTWMVWARMISFAVKPSFIRCFYLKWVTEEPGVKGLIHPNITIVSSLTHPHDISNLYDSKADIQKNVRGAIFY